MKATISGTINSDTIICKRTSGTPDIIPIDATLQDDLQCTLIGEFKSENTPDRHVRLYFHVEKIEPYTTDGDVNSIEFDGFVCKSPVSRTTPLGRKITDLLIAVNSSPFESDYLPCVVWGNCPTLKIGDYVSITGRIQSRVYHGNKIAYEVSVTCLKSHF